MKRQGLGAGGWGLGRWIVLGCVTLLGNVGVAAGPQRGGDGGGLRITVRVYDFAHVPHETLMRAEEEARGIFRKAGLETEWQPCPPNGSLENPNPVCREVLGLSGVYVRIVPRSMAARLDSRRDDLGFALGSATPGAATDAWVFYSQIEDLAARSGAPLAVILGAAVAHEIGHLLLGLESHSPRGIMRGGWHREDFELAAQGGFVFTPEQSEKMRRELTVRSVMKERAGRGAEAPQPATVGEGVN